MNVYIIFITATAVVVDIKTHLLTMVIEISFAEYDLKVTHQVY